MARLDASVYNIKGQSNRSNYRIGAVVNAKFSAINAASYKLVYNYIWSSHNKSDNGAESFA